MGIIKRKKDKVQSIIDTMQIRVVESNCKDIHAITKENFDYITIVNKDYDENGELFISFRINLNHLRGYHMLESLQLHINAMEDAMEYLGIKDSSKVEIERIDIAIDSQLNYVQNFKFFLFLFEVATYRNERSDRWFTTNLKTLENNTIILKDRSIEVCFYNKAEESNDRHIYNSRMEWRFKRISHKDYKKHLDKLIDRLQYIENNIEPLEINMSKRLIRLWNKEKEQLQSFSEFVRKYSNYFYTTGILKLVYAESGLKGSCRGWLSNFKRVNNIELFSKTDVNNHKKLMIKAIKNYKKN